MTKQALRVGLVGCGYQGQWLARAAAAVPRLEIVACADPDQVAAQQVATLAPAAEPYPTVEDLIRRAPIDAVFIATPHHLLQPYALLAVAAGKHVLVEKPVGLNSAQTAKLAAAIAQCGVTFMPGYSFRYFAEPRRAYELLRGGAIGEVRAISAGIVRAPMQGSWQTQRDAGGGPLLFVGVHLIDQILWYLADRSVEVYADIRTRPDTGVDMLASMQMRFASGVTAQLLVGDTADRWYSYLHLIGSAGQLHLSFTEFPHYSLTVRTAGGEPVTTATPGDRPSLILAKMKAELNDFADAALQGTPPPITLDDAHAVLAVLDAAAAATASGQPVRLTLP